MSLSDLFRNAQASNPFTDNMSIRNNFDGSISNPSWEQFQDYITKVEQNPQEYLVVELPTANNGIKFVQACSIAEDYPIQIGMEKDGEIALLEKVTDEIEFELIIKKFFTEGIVEGIEDYKPTT
ncbi:MAG: hypothetical protein K6F49_05895 [Saccharofermentans sp.]|nr:hypothetical protein [Saccharofermentans sp.]